MTSSSTEVANLSAGALVISLDFELHWGLRDKTRVDGSYRQNLLGVREAIPQMLALFRKNDIAATWATVGFLFARSRDELRTFFPGSRPEYTNRALIPFEEPVGRDEEEDPFHFAPTLIDAIRATPGQEIGPRRVVPLFEFTTSATIPRSS